MQQAKGDDPYSSHFVNGCPFLFLFFVYFSLFFFFCSERDGVAGKAGGIVGGAWCRSVGVGGWRVGGVEIEGKKRLRKCLPHISPRSWC